MSATPLWSDLASPPPLTGDSPPADRVFDVAIVGAGISGISAALAAEAAGASAVVLERAGVAASASGRNAGYLMRGAADNYAAAIREWGRTRAQALWAATEENLRDLLALGIEECPSYRPRPSSLAAHDENEASQLRMSAQLLREDGFAVELQSQGADTLWQNRPPICALVNPSDAVINPVELVSHLTRRLKATPLFRAALESIDTSASSELLLRTSAGAVRAQRVLLCTNTHAARSIGALPIVANRGQMCALEVPESVRLDHAYYLDHGSEYIRQHDPNTVIVGGMRKRFETSERTDSDQPTPEVQSALEACAADLLGEHYPVLARWAGTMGFTPAGLPLAGPTDHPAVWVCCGFTGHGMSLAHRTATHTAWALLSGAPLPAWADSPQASSAG